MALRRALCTLPRPPPPRPGACPAPPAPPLCPPCPAAPPPPCRVQQHQPRPTKRVVCHPPPAGHLPPCPPCDPTPPRTCEHARPHDDKTTSAQQQKVESKPGLKARAGLGGACDRGSDPVARRLAAAELARRADYMREVSRPPACAPPRPPPPHWCPGAAPPAAHEHEQRCERRERLAVDPCAHTPRVIVEIDRSKVNSTKTKTECETPRVPSPTHPPEPAPKHASTQSKKPSGVKTIPQTRGLTSRIMESLNLGGKTSHEAKASAPPAPPGAAPASRCAMSPPAPQPPRCRERSLVEWLRGRRSGRGGRGARGTRSLHTSAVRTDSGKVRAMLEERARLKETGRGRELAGCGRGGGGCAGGGGSAPHLAGRLELCSPAPRALRVDVYALPAAPPATTAPSNDLTPACTTQKPACLTPEALTLDKKASWLSIKSLQKKMSPGRRCGPDLPPRRPPPPPPPTGD